ncbi:uncharacterized protein [Temnothorax longispinosus]|uniref:uncharacterized protein n=1 Tax=Temnothorax longispinosus TaxID=300112 RepID=UPI003A98F38B
MYTANVLARNDNKKILNEILKNINKEKPYIICKRIQFNSTDKVNTYVENNDVQVLADKNTRISNTRMCVNENIHNGEADTRRQDDSLKNHVRIPLDTNTRILCVDENMHNKDADVQREDSGFLGNNGVQVPLDTNTRTLCVDENKRNEDADVEKEDSSLRNNNVQIPLDTNTRILCVDENMHNKDADVQKEDSGFLGNNDVQVPLDTNTKLMCVDENMHNNNTEAGMENFEVLMSVDVDVIDAADIYIEGMNTPFIEDTNTIVSSGQIINPVSSPSSQVPSSISTSHNVNKDEENSSDSEYLPSEDEIRSLERNEHNESPFIEGTNTIVSSGQIINPVSSLLSQVPSSISTSHDVNEGEENSSDSEYLPSEDEIRLLERNEHNESQKRKTVLSKTVSSVSSADVSAENIGTSACNDENMYVEKSNVITKHNYCYFCLKLQTQISRHLETVHRNEPEVKKFAVLPKGNPERKKIIDIIRKNGNFKFNTMSENNNGKLIVCRRPNAKYNKSATDFIACAKCKGFFAKTTIRHHSRSCLKTDFSKNRCIMIMGRKVTCRIHHLANDTLKKIVFPVMREDEVTRIIRYDELLILYANKLCIKYNTQHQHDMIRARLRLLGRFLLALKKINTSVEDFKSLYHPRVYDDCISAINIVAGYVKEENIYKSPAVAANLSTLLKHVGNVLITEYIKRDDSEKKKLAKDFLKLLVVDIGTSVNKTVIETQSAQKRHKKINLPSIHDIQKLYKHLEQVRTEAYMELEKSFSYKNWVSLAEATLTSIHVFNRRRAGEMERVLINDFKNCEKINEDMYTDIYTSLSEQNQKIAQNYSRFCIRGKLGRTVPVLLTNELLKCINLILQLREKAEVPKKNPYVFGLPGYNKNRYRYLRACLLMRKFAQECNANESSSLRGTILRKHVATHCIQLNLTDIDVSDLATFMGHAEKIHREHYRQPLASRDILKISQYLEAVQGIQNLNESESEEDEKDERDEVFNAESANQEEQITYISSCNTSNDDIINEIEENNKRKSSRKCLRYDTSNDDIRDMNKTQKNNKQKRSTSPYGKTKRQRWTHEETETALRVFAIHMKNLTLPTFREIQEVKKNYSCLSHRTSPQIKAWINNKQKPLKAVRPK